MQIILKENVKDLGHIGDVVNVKDGYARNFLIPKGLAVEANPKNIKALEHEKRKIHELAKKVKASAEELAARISGTSVTIKAKTGEEDKLFGSVTAMDIADALKKEGIDIDKKKIVLDEPIKRLGSYTVNVKIHSDVTAQLNVQVVSE
ncbi:MAG: 50S ribosomal protein L9 [Thermodesulfovibrionales bacterium]|jgi:large subunit ribosomal protein L9|nr:50S ribosomal protein L9 [Thermodesulfovibrionales bacterium]